MPSQLVTNKAADLIDRAVLLSKNVGKQIPYKKIICNQLQQKRESELGNSTECKSGQARLRGTVPKSLLWSG